MAADADEMCTLQKVTDKLAKTIGTLPSVADDSSANPIVVAANNENLQICVGKASIG
jgi:hypothetical protein